MWPWYVICGVALVLGIGIWNLLKWALSEAFPDVVDIFSLERQATQDLLQHLGPEIAIGRSNGAMRWLMKNGMRVSGSYHFFSLKDGVVYGHLGAWPEEVVVDAEGTIYPDGGSERRNREHLIARLGPEYCFRKKDKLWYLTHVMNTVSEGYNEFHLHGNRVMAIRYSEHVEIAIPCPEEALR